MVLARVNKETRARIGRSRVWIKMKHFSKTDHLHRKLMDAIWTLIASPEYKGKLFVIAIGSSDKN